jgi:hypothetical protein
LVRKCPPPKDLQDSGGGRAKILTEENFSDQKIVSPVRIIYFSCNRLGEKKLKLMEISKEEPEAKRRMGR